MYTVSKGPSKIVAKTRRGLTQNYEKFQTIKESGKRSIDVNHAEKVNLPRPIFQTRKGTAQAKSVEENIITPQHEEIIRYINDSWNIIVAQNPYDEESVTANTYNCIDSNNNNNANSSANDILRPILPSMVCAEPPSPLLRDFKPFDLESWWGRRLYNNITKSL